ncbi:hypothetical protein K1Y77_12595 [Halomonas qaidamensis]|uniref:Bacterial transcriptional activator domain-containing protein n=1 Tax=Halomonas qaidamensis TaxID=2866211 RepID=A0ABY6JM23_9GAMM|nr:hypothetical protein [Halomonas qaidamensis]UYV18316.1 hypothetical protein K1Y77_12595 [Halomonas qaidamensis]
MQPNQLSDISRKGLQLAIQEIREEMFDTPECDYTIAKLLSHCGQFETAERHIDEMLLKWGASPEVTRLTEQAYTDLVTFSADNTESLSSSVTSRHSSADVVSQLPAIA